MSDAPDKTAAIRALNDRCRQEFVDCRSVVTRAVQALDESQRAQLLEAVRTFDAFCEDNDPHGEHDFGNFDKFGDTWFWKFDYYNPEMDGGSEDPADPGRTCRVLTIMRAGEY